jgi:hypothetical protein
MNVAGTVTFPPNDFTGFKTDELPNLNEEYSPWGLVTAVPSSHIIAIPESLTTSFGDDVFVGAFTTEGIFAGACPIQKGQNQVLVVNADDPVTPEKDGFADGEPFTFSIWDGQTKEESEVVVDFNPNQPNHSGLFAADGISAFSALEIVNNIAGNSLGNLQIFPNPTHGLVNITGIRDGSVLKVTVFNQTGQLVLVQTLESDFQIDLHEFPAGIYFLKLDDGRTMKHKKLVLE